MKTTTRCLVGILAAASSAILATVVCAPSDEPATRPNVILIITDDQGYGDLGVTGNLVIRTPHIDEMAARSAHGPFHDVPEELLAEYLEIDLSNERFPQELGHPLPAEADVDRRARIFAMITNIDENVGRLFGRLDALGMTEDSIVIFMVDNGPNGRRYVAGMRGSKSHVHEGSLLPLLADEPAEWPNRQIVIQAHRGDVPVRYHNFLLRGPRYKLFHPSGFGEESFEGEPAFEPTSPPLRLPVDTAW